MTHSSFVPPSSLDPQRVVLSRSDILPRHPSISLVQAQVSTTTEKRTGNHRVTNNFHRIVRVCRCDADSPIYRDEDSQAGTGDEFASEKLPMGSNKTIDISDSSSQKRPGRKPMADNDSHVNLDDDPKTKRKVQNRAAQRAFRERRERYVKELELKIKQVQDNHFYATAQLIQENQYLRSIVYRLEAENFALKGIHIQFPNTYYHPSWTDYHLPPVCPPPMSIAASSSPRQYTFSVATLATLRTPSSKSPEKRNDNDNQSHGFPSPNSYTDTQVPGSPDPEAHSRPDDTLDALLSEPLFDPNGGLNLALTSQNSRSYLTDPQQNLNDDILSPFRTSDLFSSHHHPAVDDITL